MMFNHEAAKAYVGSWVDTVNDPTLNWAWDVVCGVLDVYTEYGEDPAEDVWSDWFSVVLDDSLSAHIGIHGVGEEFSRACPEEHQDALSRILTEAFRVGKALPPYEEGEKKKDTVPAPKTRRPKLTLIVDNTSHHNENKP